MKTLSIHQTPDNIIKAQNEHRWLIQIIERVEQESRFMPFYQSILRANQIEDFKWTVQLFHHSRTLPRFIGLVLSQESDDSMMRFYAEHLSNEAPHSSWLLEWMTHHGIVRSEREACLMKPSVTTNSCINYGARLAQSNDREAWLIGINCGIEKASHQLFSTIEPILSEVGLSHIYFRTHVVADKHHSTEALTLVNRLDPQSERALYLRDLLLEGLSLWYGMLNSWVGVNYIPLFNGDGSLLQQDYVNSRSTG
jgi:pyrroloquinoline quinone (PQQ) biosynthesis protein C